MPQHISELSWPGQVPASRSPEISIITCEDLPGTGTLQTFLVLGNHLKPRPSLNLLYVVRLALTRTGPVHR